MNSQIEALRQRATENRKRIILPEGHDPRVVEAASKIEKLGIADIILIGNESDIKNTVKEKSLILNKTEIIDPQTYPKKDEIIDTFLSIRGGKGVTREDAMETVLGDPVYFGALLARLGVADGFVAGASHTTADVARAALYCLGLDREIGIMSSSFVIELEDCPYGNKGLFIFGDCGVVPNPNSNKLAGIAISCSRLYDELFKDEARVALLSYSTRGSAAGESPEKVVRALEIVKTKAPELIVDGEMQPDAALVPEVAKIKAPGSPVAGRANVLIFPNLDAGNITYKLTQRLGRARVVGPLLQGLKKPASDLSRGCGVEEIIDAVAVIAVRAQQC